MYKHTAAFMFWPSCHHVHEALFHVPAVPAVQYAKAQGIMCSYNAFNGTPACANGPMLSDMLRNRLGFNGYVVSDCNAVMALTWGHQSAASLTDASAAAINAGVDIFCDRIDAVCGGDSRKEGEKV